MLSNWSWCWKLKLPANFQFFLCQFCHNSLPIKATLMRKNVLDSATCLLCNIQDETSHHCFFLCHHAREVWSLCFNSNFVPPTSTFTPSVWLEDIVRRHGPLHVIIMWNFWCARNLYIFKGKQVKAYEVVAQSYTLLSDVLAAFGSMVNSARVTSGVVVSWIALSVG